MNIRLFKTLSTQEQKEYMWSVLEKESAKAIAEMRKHLFPSNEKGHMIEKHCALSTEDMVRRVISEMHAVGRFDQDEEVGDPVTNAMECVESVFFDDKVMQDIAKWMCTLTSRPLAITVDMRAPVGTVVDTDFKEYESNVIRVICNKDFSNYDNELGMTVTSAFCLSKKDIPKEMLERDCIRETGRDYSELAKQLLRQEKNALCRGYWGLQMSGITQAYINNKNLESRIVVPLNYGGQCYYLNIFDPSVRNTFISHEDADGKRTRYYDFASEDLPKDIRDKVTDIMSTYQKFVDDKASDARDSLTEHNIFDPRGNYGFTMKDTGR